MSVRRSLSVIVLALLTSGCFGDAGSRTVATTRTTVATVSTPTTAPGRSSQDTPHGGFHNPVYDGDFPDPGIIKVDSGYVAFSTNSAAGNVPMLSSADLVHWRSAGDALPRVGSWASTGSTWAPEVIRLGRQFVMFYVAKSTAEGRQCIGRAGATSATGPYVDAATRPLVCQAALGGSIDPSPYLGPDGAPYLVWKNDGNCCGSPVHLWAQRLSADGASLLGHPEALLSNTKSWQGNLVEAPEMLAVAGGFDLFYSANGYDTDRYAIGWARCTGPLGPCTDQSAQPLVTSDDVAAGPGHCFLIRSAGGGLWMAFHAWQPDAIGAISPGRQLWLTPVRLDGVVPVVDRPSPIEPVSPS